jgi:hypothetical protein
VRVLGIELNLTKHIMLVHIYIYVLGYGVCHVIFVVEVSRVLFT